MNMIRGYLSGRKTNLTAAVLFTLAVTAAVNDWTAPELAAFAAAVATISVTLRTAIASSLAFAEGKTRSARKAGLVLFLAGALGCAAVGVGCKGFYRVDPETGTSPAEDMGAGIAEFSVLLPPPWNTMVPAVVALLTIGGAAKLKSKELE